MEFFIIFIVTTIVLVFVAVMMAVGRPPIYHVTREEALLILQRQIAGELEEVKWLVFIGHAIPMDPELNEVHLACAQLELDTEQGVLKYGASSRRYDEEGIERLKSIEQSLTKLIAETPITREF